MTGPSLYHRRTTKPKYGEVQYRCVSKKDTKQKSRDAVKRSSGDREYVDITSFFFVGTVSIGTDGRVEEKAGVELLLGVSSSSSS